MAAFRLFLLVVALTPLVAPAQAPTGADSVDTALSPGDSTAAAKVQRDSLMQGALPELRVIRPRLSLSTPTAVTTVEVPSVAASGGQPISDVLASKTSAFVKQYGAGGLATASLRGLGPSQTLVLVDGHRLADPQTGQADLSLVPSLLLESARLLHGSHGARYGSGSLGGVVQLQTIDPAAPLRVEFMGGVGDYGWRSGSGIVSTAGEKWSGLVAAEVSGSSGRFPYENTTLVPARTERRKNAHRAHETVYGKVTRERSSSKSTASLWWNHTKRGLPGTATSSPSNAEQTDTQWRLGLRHRHAVTSGHVELALRGQRSTLQFRNPGSSPALSQSDTSVTHRVSTKASTQLMPSSDLLVAGGITAGFDRAHVRGGVTQWRFGAFVDAAWSLGPMTLQPAVRLDGNRPSHDARAVTALTPSLGLAWTPGPDWIRLKGKIGRAYRVPTLNERFYKPGGNPDLRAETGWSAETGVAARTQSSSFALSTEATLFHTQLSDQIVWHPSYVGPGLQVWRPSNLAKVRTRGLEWRGQGRWRVAERLRLDGRLTYSHVIATDQSIPHARSYGHQLPYTPRDQLKAHVGLTWGPARLDLSTRLVGPRYVTADETQALAPYRISNVGLQLEHSVGPTTVTAHLEIRNALDESYSIVRLYPMPPRHVRARLTMSIR